MNYFGGKGRVAKYIVPIIQKTIDDNNIHAYLEPMCGGLSIIDKIKCNKKYAYDLNKYLISLFIHLKGGGILPEDISDEYYNALRIAWHNNNAERKFQDWEIGLLWLSSFSGRGPDGGRSIRGFEKRKDGTVKERFYYQERKANILKQFEQPLCKDIIFGVGDYKKLTGLSNYVIYVDPPYENKKEFANSIGFNYREFWNIMREWSKDNIVFTSELEAPSDFKVVWEHEVSRSINAKDKGKATEKLFVYKEGRQP